MIIKKNQKNKQNTNTLIGIRLKTGQKNYYIFRDKYGKFYYHSVLELTDKKFLHFPVRDIYKISSNFNLNRLHPITGKISPHKGIDFAVPIGTPILTINNGIVIENKKNKISGNYISIMHDKKYITKYMHLKQSLVQEGQKVKQGECIGFSGNTGRSTGPHLHFEVWVNKKAINPLNIDLSYIIITSKKNKKYYPETEWMLEQLKYN
ncbi:MAG: peptidoglycan DD-endopeptidase MepM [Candidatus Westeberhardia cardiocondylae]|nr:peptidoglycan DD-endopeptidase MepM [Candidatus Westeberhardia cardiocondylae]